MTATKNPIKACKLHKADKWYRRRKSASGWFEDNKKYF